MLSSLEQRSNTRPHRLLLVELLTVALMAGCATAKGAMFTKAPAPHNGQGILYVYRRNTTLVYTPKINIDGRFVSRLERHGYFWTALDAGIHEIHVDWPLLSGQPEVRFDMDIVAGKSHYVKVAEDVELSGMYIEYRTMATEVPEEEALKELSHTRLVEDRK